MNCYFVRFVLGVGGKLINNRTEKGIYDTATKIDWKFFVTSQN
jgi:hypothetical protein